MSNGTLCGGKLYRGFEVIKDRYGYYFTPKTKAGVSRWYCSTEEKAFSAIDYLCELPEQEAA